MTASPEARVGDYELGRVLGRGGFGEVREAFRITDRRRFALKVLHDPDGAAIRDLKHEARTLWNLPLRGLATPTDLGVYEGRWFAALPLVEGEDIVTACRRVVATERDEWIADKIAQVADTIASLHDAGLLHLDIKPANIMVSLAGIVTLLDFGFSRWVRNVPPGALEVAAESGGTLEYMAPEIIGGLVPTESADWYSVGALLHELLCGAPPAIAWPGSNVALGESALERLCAGLLTPDRATRSAASDVRRQLALDPAPARVRAPFVGRMEEMRRVTDLLDEQKQCVVILRGAAGVGKTRILHAFEDVAAERRLVTIVGRCYEHDRTPYRGFEELASLLRDAEGAADQEAHWLVSGAPEGTSSEDRMDAHRAVVDRLRTAVGRRGSVLVLDDMQWLDEDGATLLSSLVAAPESPVRMLLASTRSEDTATETRRRLDERGASAAVVVEIAVDPLESPSAEALARGCAPDLPEDQIRSIVGAAEGSPFVIELLASRPNVDVRTLDGASLLRQALDARLGDLAAPEKAAMELVALAAGPVTEDAIVSACAAANASEPSFAKLRSGAWLRSVAGPEIRVAIYHDILRSHVAASLSAEKRADLTGALLEGLVATKARPHETFTHARALGQRQRAAEMALAAGEEAEQALAFDAAARWYEEARGLGDAVWTATQNVAVRAANGWYAAGRPAPAAPLFIVAANSASDADREDLVRRAADALMVGGSVTEGRTLLAPWLARHSIPGTRSRIRVAFAIIRRLLWLRVPGVEHFLSRDASSPRGVIAWTLGKGLAYTDALDSLDYALVALRFAIADGDRRLAATLLAFVGGGVLQHIPGLRARGQRYLQIASDLAAALDDGWLRAHVDLWRAIKQIDAGEWERAMATFDEVLPTLVATRDSHWERLTLQQSRLWIIWKRGDFTGLREETAAALNDSTERGDELGRVVFSELLAFASLVEGSTAAARRVTAWVRDSWATDRFTVQRFYGALIDNMAACLDGDIQEGWRAWREIQRDFRLSGGTRAPVVAIDNLEAEARLRIHGGVAQQRGDLQRIAKRMRAFKRPFGTAMAGWIDVALGGDATRAIHTMRDVGLECVALAIELQTGADVSERLRARGVADPETWARAIYPLGRTPT